MEEEQALEKLSTALNKLTKLESTLKSTSGYTQEVLDLTMLIEFVKEQVSSEDSRSAVG